MSDWSTPDWSAEDLRKYLQDCALEDQLADACPICGERGACEYDREGQPLIHVVRSTDS